MNSAQRRKLKRSPQWQAKQMERALVGYDIYFCGPPWRRRKVYMTSPLGHEELEASRMTEGIFGSVFYTGTEKQ